MSDEVLVEYAGPTVIITINRPEAKNAINRAVTDGVAAAIEELEARADLTVGILTGADNCHGKLRARRLRGGGSLPFHVSRHTLRDKRCHYFAKCLPTTANELF